MKIIKKVLSFLFETKESRLYYRGMGEVDIYGDETKLSNKSEKATSFRGLELSECDFYMNNEEIRLNRGPRYGYDSEDID